MKTAIPYTAFWWFLPLWVIASGYLLYFASQMVYENWLFSDHAVLAQGEVLQKFQRVSQGARHGPHYTPYVVYSYEAGPMRNRCETRVQAATWSVVSPGELIPIKYLPENPSESRINFNTENYAVTFRTWVTSGVALATLLVGAVLFPYFNWRNNLRARLIREGVSCMGRVTAMPEIPWGKSGTATYLELRFTDQTGREILGKTGNLSSWEKSSWETGMAIRVFYDRANPELFTVDLSV